MTPFFRSENDATMRVCTTSTGAPDGYNDPPKSHGEQHGQMPVDAGILAFLSPRVRVKGLIALRSSRADDVCPMHVFAQS
eukprot:6191008-Pleurochrysis_carterae.AAC.4